MRNSVIGLALVALCGACQADEPLAPTAALASQPLSQDTLVRPAGSLGSPETHGRHARWLLGSFKLAATKSRGA
jgi:hypothetical protein